MASTLLTLLDDIASILDDVATMSKVALKKTAGVVGDDLALNAEQLVGVHVNRELPVVWAVAKGSARNKLILVPVALIISVLLPRNCYISGSIGNTIAQTSSGNTCGRLGARSLNWSIWSRARSAARFERTLFYQQKSSSSRSGPSPSNPSADKSWCWPPLQF